MPIFAIALSPSQAEFFFFVLGGEQRAGCLSGTVQERERSGVRGQLVALRNDRGSIRRFSTILFR